MSKVPTCQFCGASFTQNSSLNRHIKDRCISKKDPERLLKIIELKDELLAQKNIIIEQLRDTKPNIEVEKIDQQNCK